MESVYDIAEDILVHISCTHAGQILSFINFVGDYSFCSTSILINGKVRMLHVGSVPHTCDM